ncbi:MAG: molecular chaperone DnaK, partial [Solirubrobacteraceae bacterium]|nr:molecular chaperone DnaK [Solirubrobacteraceae bacterium]
NLDQGDIDRMIREAEQNSASDRRQREEVDARNELDSLAYQVERLINDLQDQLPVHEKARAEQLVADARAAVAEQAGLDRVRPLISDLQQLVSTLPSAAAASGGGNGASANGGEAAEVEEDEEVVDAEFTRD